MSFTDLGEREANEKPFIRGLLLPPYQYLQNAIL